MAEERAKDEVVAPPLESDKPRHSQFFQFVCPLCKHSARNPPVEHLQDLLRMWQKLANREGRTEPLSWLTWTTTKTRERPEGSFLFTSWYISFTFALRRSLFWPSGLHRRCSLVGVSPDVRSATTSYQDVTARAIRDGYNRV